MFKKLPYWLKGGIISLSIGLILITTTFLCFPFFKGEGKIMCMVFILPIIYPISIFFPQIENAGIFKIIIPLFFCFAIGALIGLIIKVMKKKAK